MKKVLLLFCVSTFISCSKPIANFLINTESYDAPVLINFENTSENAEVFEWKVNGKTISNDSATEYLFLSSGRHEIDLLVQKDNNKSQKTQTVFINAPEKCLFYMKTNMGAMVFELSELTPIHRDNFLSLIESGYYNGLNFHRIIDGFMIQGGDNKTRKDKESKYKYKDRISAEITKDLIHHRGALAAARNPDNVNPDKMSSGTQFYIVDGIKLTKQDISQYESSKLFNYTPEQVSKYEADGGTPQLDGEYTVFGRLLSGFDVLEKISQVETGDRDVPNEDVIILEVKIIN